MVACRLLPPCQGPQVFNTEASHCSAAKNDSASLSLQYEPLLWTPWPLCTGSVKQGDTGQYSKIIRASRPATRITGHLRKTSRRAREVPPLSPSDGPRQMSHAFTLELSSESLPQLVTDPLTGEGQCQYVERDLWRST